MRCIKLEEKQNYHNTQMYITGKSDSTENYYNERTLICQINDDDNENL